MSHDLTALLPELADSVAVSLQEGAFIMSWPVDDAGPLASPSVDTEVTMRSADRTLVVGVSVTRDLARQVAQDTLGELDPDAVGEDDARDAVLELANVVAGRLAKRFSSAGALVTLTPPVIRTGTASGAVFLAMETDSGARVRCSLHEGAR
jgi:hypothetical protein